MGGAERISAAVESAIDREAHGGTGTRLQGRWLAVARLAWIVITLFALALFFASVPPRYNEFSHPDAPVLVGLARLGLSTISYATIHIVLWVAYMLGFLVVALVIFRRKSNDWMALFVSFMLAMMGTTDIMDALVNVHPQWGVAVDFLSALALIGLLLFLYVFPDGRFVPRWTGALAVVWTIYVFVTAPYAPERWSPLLWALSSLFWFSTGVFAQVYRYRRAANLTQRQQTKWVVFGLTAAFFGFFGSTLPDAFFSLRHQPGPAGVLFGMGWTFIFVVSILLLPLSIGFSILRYRLWDIDLIINRTLVYVPLTATLAGLYSASITLLQQVFIALTGNRSDAAVVLTTLILVSVFTPIRTTLQDNVDRHFKEPADPVKPLRVFAEQVRSRIFLIDVEQIIHRLLDAAVEGFDAVGGAAYLRQRGEWQLVHTRGEWRGEAQVSVPLESDGVWLGLISLGERRYGVEYALRDREALRQVLDQIAQAIKRQQEVHIDTQ